MSHQHDSQEIEVKPVKEYSNLDILGLYDQVFAENDIDNYFLSFDWISNWIAQLDSQIELITFTSNNKVIGFVFIGCQKSILGNIFLLNQTGVKDEDQVWIEYNDIISLSAHKQCSKALLAHLYARRGTFKLIVCNASRQNWQDTHWATWSNQTILGYKTKLTQANVGSHYSKNTKNQLTRAKKYIKHNYGEIWFQNVKPIDASKALENIANLHIQKWNSHPSGSGFSNPKFVDFHRSLINKNLNCSVHILKFVAGDTDLGYLQYFSDKERIYFYLSAIDYKDTNNNFKPGLIMHTMAMQYFAEQGFTEYDFLAGEARYKTSLSNTEYSFNTIHLFRNKWYYRPIRQMVSVKRWFIKTFLEK